MIAALTVYSGDAAAALRLLEWITELGGVGYHTLLLGTTAPVNPHPMLEVARKAWGGVEHYTIDTQNEASGWPSGPNINFSSVCSYLKERNAPFFFLESDCFPTCANWLDQLEREYLSMGKPFMGNVHSMIHPATGDVVPDSQHMNGAGIYPANVTKYLPTLPFITGALANQPWDVALRWEILFLVDGNGGFKTGPDGRRISGCHATDKICFSWRTEKFRIENDQLVYDTMGPAHKKALDFSKHVLHHGCKDGSLLNILRARLSPPSVQPPSLPVPVAPAVVTQGDGAPREPHDAPQKNSRLPAAAFKPRADRPPPRQIAKKRKTGGKKKPAPKVATPAPETAPTP